MPKRSWLVMFLLQVFLFWSLTRVYTVAGMTVLTFIVLMCYGGGFGTMPAFAADFFGPQNVGPIYGLMLTAWGTASAVSPLSIAYLRQSTGSYHLPLYVIAAVMAISVLLPLFMFPPKTKLGRESELAQPETAPVRSKAA